jgi:protein tyrosine phosphatase (PTP) superfamily phosphohydrolase (DUF442 family)
MFEEIYNFLALSDILFTGGMPKEDQIESAAQAGVQTVINLALHNSPRALPDEEHLVKSLDMQYINIPVDWDNPTRQNLDDFMDAMDLRHAEKVLVHCQANYRATGFTALYRVLRQGWNPDDALAVMHKIWDEEKYPVWKKFIQDNLPNREK